MQKTIIIGNLTDNPVGRATPTGKDLCTFTVAVNEKHGDKEEATFYNCTAWERRSVPILAYVHKGDKVAVEGKVRARPYTDKNGEARASLDMTVENCEFLVLRKQDSKQESKPEDRFTPIEDDADMPF